MRSLKRKILFFKVIISLFLVTSVSILIPSVGSQPGKCLISKISTQKEHIKSITLSEEVAISYDEDVNSQGLFDFIIMLLNFLITVIQKLIKLISNAIQLVILLENIIEAVETLIDLIDQLIQAISDIFDPDMV